MPDTIDPGRPHAYVPGAAGGRCLTCYRPADHRIHGKTSEPQPMPDLTPEEVRQIREFATGTSHPAGDLVLHLCDAIDHLRAELEVTRSAQGPNNSAEKLGGPLDGKVLWRGKTGPMPGVDNERLSLITAEIAPGTEVAVVLTEHESATRGTGICPTCERPIGDHDDSERKACHDAVSGYRRAVVLTGEDGDA